MFAASKSGAPVAAKDPQFPYVTMLLHGDGTNGAQNNTFLDSSTNNFTITRNGNTTQGTFSPYGANWSNYFDGSSAYLSVATNAGFGMGTGDCTLECWYYPLNSTVGIQTLIDIRTTNTGVPVVIGVLSSGAPYAYNGTTYSGSTVTNNSWNHIAFVRNGSGTNNCKLYLNGTQVTQFTDTADWGSTDTCAIGRNTGLATEYALGYISNARVVKGTAVYTSAFTPSTTPLTAVSGTSLLTCQSNRFVDNSASPLTITVNGSPSVQRFSPFSPTTAYSTSVIGGSGYFDGSGDTLNTASNAAFGFGSGAWTLEAWVYPTVAQTDNWIIATNDSGKLRMRVGASGYLSFYTDTGNISLNSTTVVTVNAWSHVAICYDGTTLSLFQNGTRTATSTVSISNGSANACYIGSNTVGGSYWNGYISNARVVKGSAVYSGATYTVPTAPLTAISGTSLLLEYTNAGILDNAMMNDLETVGNAQISTSVKKYGTGSMAFDGSGDYLKPNMATPDLYAFGSGDFTIEFWGYILQTTPEQMFIDWRPAGTQTTQPLIYVTSAGVLAYYVSAANRITGATLSTSTWYHIAVSRSGTSTKMFLNGTQTGSTWTDTTVYTNVAGRPVISLDGNTTNSGYLNGYIDDLRVTKGYARYTSNFTAPTAAFPNN